MLDRNWKNGQYFKNLLKTLINHFKKTLIGILEMKNHSFLKKCPFSHLVVILYLAQNAVKQTYKPIVCNFPKYQCPLTNENH